MIIKVYDLNMHLVAYLENAFAIGYETPFNSLWTASFSLPADDPKNAECLPLRFVEIFDGDERVDIFRIIPTDTQRSADGETITYSCEHVLATLLDDVLFQYHQVGNLGVYTADVLQYILGKQLMARWRLGSVAFGYQFEYKWENDNLLGALFSVPKPFVEAYQWTWDTSSSPWTLNLVAPETAPSCRIRYGYNLKGIKKTEDPTQLCTRLYCLGYGEGVNQLTIRDVNGGLEHLDADTISQYGVISRIFTDRRFEHAETLKARGQALLEELKLPRLTYQVEAAELYRLTDDIVHKFRCGAMVQIVDDELGIDVTARVVNVHKPDIDGAPGDAQIEISNRPTDIAGSIADLADRQRINDVYSQGATNLDSHDFSDNADPQSPAVIRFYIPTETVRINKVLLSYQCEAFRAYSKAIAAAPAVTSGPSSINTTESGGGVTETSTTSSNWNQFSINIPDAVSPHYGHTHTVVVGGTAYTTSDDGNHGHALTSDHTHSVTIRPHVHEMPHTHVIPEHTHEIEYGIFEGPTPSSVTLTVDGTVIGQMDTTLDGVDLVSQLAKDGGGKIQRGWHEIKIAPNDLGRIVASVNTQIFVQSRGGGNY